MTAPVGRPGDPSFDEVASAIRSSWSLETTATPGVWRAARPSIGQCDASSYVAWEYFGGDLVLSKVLVDGEQREHHYSNRIDGCPIDLTIEQFDGHEDIVEIAVLADDDIRARSSAMRRELADRIEILRRSVAARLA